MIRNMKILVTGATGFLGTHIVSHLLQKGVSVIGLDIEDFYFHQRLRREIELFKFDVRDILSHADHFKGVDAVIHCAAALHDSPPEIINAVNLGGTRSVLDLCLKNDIPKAIFCSSTVVYGYFEHEPPVTEETPTAPVHPYAVSKVACENMMIEYRDKGLNACIVRPKSFIGAGRLGVFQLLCDWVMRGARVPVIGNGKNRYQLMGVSDLAEGFYRIATLPIKNETINLGTDKFTTVKEDLEGLLAHARTGSTLLFLPAKPVKLALSMLGKLKLTQMWEWHYKTADRDSYVDICKAQRLINWDPVQSNVDILIETYDWYVAHHKEYARNQGLGHHGVVWRERLLRCISSWL